MAKDKGQAANRRWQIWRDQHGRRWGSTVDKRDDSQAPASPPTPEGGWLAPYMPGPEYLTMPVGPQEQYGLLLVNYEKWLADVEQSWTDRQARTDGLARAYAQSDDFLYAQLLANPSAAMLAALGPAPLHPHYVKACAAGDAWALGLSPEQPAWAKKHWPDGVVDPRRVTKTVDLSFLDAEDEPPAPIKRKPGRPRRVTASLPSAEGVPTE